MTAARASRSRFLASTKALHVAGEIAIGMVSVATAAGAVDGTLEIPEPGIRPVHQNLLWPTAAGDDRQVAHAGLGDPLETGEPITDDDGTRPDVGRCDP